jgi:hypothetical protein
MLGRERRRYGLGLSDREHPGRDLDQNWIQRIEPFHQDLLIKSGFGRVWI